jgi:hypothetical protein
MNIMITGNGGDIRNSNVHNVIDITINLTGWTDGMNAKLDT